MAGTQIQRRRGTTAEHASFTGAVGELTVDTTKKTVVVHDGSTAGGLPLARENLANVPNGSVTNVMLADAELQTLAGMSSSRATFLAGTEGFATRNRLINGDMRIDQRNAGASVTVTNTSALTYTVDRWGAYGNVASKFSVQQNAGAVTPPAGYINYLGATSLSAYSVLAGDNFTINQFIEGLNTPDLAWGTASAVAVTLSFWVRSSLTGTFGGVVKNSAQTRSYPFTYTISSANTWEQKTVTVPGDTTGTWLTNTGTGIILSFSLGAGTTQSGTAGTWAGSNFASATGAVSVVGTNAATFYITGVQLEAGSVATPFERRSYGVELALCQRYYGLYNYLSPTTAAQTGATTYGALMPFKASMRAVPTVTFSSAQDGTGTAGSITAFTAAASGVNITPNGNAVYVDGIRVGFTGTAYTYIQGSVFANAEL